MSEQLRNNIFEDTADMFLVDENVAEKEGLLKDESDSKCKKVFLTGKHSHTTADFMEEVYTVLNFPSFFGRNWSAFNDSFKEKLWKDEDNYERYLLVFTHADELLVDASEDDMTLLLETLEDVIEALADPESIMPIKVIFCQHASTSNGLSQAFLKGDQNNRKIRLN